MNGYDVNGMEIGKISIAVLIRISGGIVNPMPVGQCVVTVLGIEKHNRTGRLIIHLQDDEGHEHKAWFNPCPALISLVNCIGYSDKNNRLDTIVGKKFIGTFVHDELGRVKLRRWDKYIILPPIPSKYRS